MAIKVVYHNPCMDGFGAAFSAWKKFGDEAEYIPLNYGQETPEFQDEDEVYLLDFSFPMETMWELYNRLKFFVCIDHHKTLREDMQKWVGETGEGTYFPFIIFDNDHSGAVMAWAYFHNNFHESPYSQVPDLLRYVEDRDLWNWELNHSQEVNIALQSYDKSFHLWDEIVSGGSDALYSLIEEGFKLLEHQRKAVDDICENAQVKNFLGHEVPVVRSKNFQSEVGHKLCYDYPIAPFAVINYTAEEGEKYSLRSDGEFDVSALAKSMGGGGHKAAAGFTIKDGTDPTELMKKYGEE